MKKKILILNATAGLGHINAAKALEEVFDKNHQGIEIINKDILDFSNGLYRKIFSDGYTYISSKLPRVWKWFYNNYNDKNTQALLDWVSKLSIDKKMSAYIKELKPDFIVATNPLPSRLISENKDEYVRTIPLGTVVTDWGVHAYWFAEETDYYFVASEQTKLDLEKLDIDEHKIHITGIPIRSIFSKKLAKKPLIKKYKLSENLFTLLIIGSEMKVEELERIVNKMPLDKMNVVLIAGRDKELQDKLKKSSLGDHKKVKVFGFVDKIEEFLSMADVIASKTGGLTTSECMALGLPMISHKVIPGQEEDNINFLVTHGAGVRAKNADEVANTINHLVNNPAELKTMQKNAKEIGKPHAAQKIAEIIVKRVSSS